MILPPACYIRDVEIERQAMALLREHEFRTGRPLRLPVPVDGIIERTLGLRIVWMEVEEDNGDIILARIDPRYEGHPTIQMNERRMAHFDAYFGTESYSKAHEAGHWVLHLDRGRSEQPPLDGLFDEEHDVLLCRRLSDGDRRELQTERFGAFLLLPEHLLRPMLADLDLSRWTVVAELARDCGVSKTAMRRRLEQLGELLVGPNGQLVPTFRQRSAGPLL